MEISHPQDNRGTMVILLTVISPSQVKRTVAGKSANRPQINQSRRFDVQINAGFDGLIWMPIEMFLNAS